ncbi:M24 family metallopeptidase [Herbidospora yilanensis]|uniref:M24 family metallopeptidase n=1 Tax=Herbidospora yilanensis TaxID=354426 RepID=UPI000A862FE2|nr:M24 family metallopeptidase [Herbidospora yilanensis]
MSDHLLFSYGTLRLPQVQSARFGRELDGRPDALLGFRLETVKITDASVVADSGSDEHPVAVPSDDPRDAVEGMVFTLTPDDLAAADAYEVDDYLRVKAGLRSGEKAWVYVDAATAERFRADRLLTAQANAVTLFDEIVRRGLIAPGRTEKDVSDDIRDLANEMFGTTRHWHKRIVRSGPNTLLPYRENPPDRAVEADDIVFCDFGPIFEEFEADLGRTYVLGDDPVKHRLAADLPVVFEAGRRFFAADSEMTGARLFAEVDRLARERGWVLGHVHAGHLVGEFPHETIDADDIESYIAEGNTTPMRRVDRAGRVAHWILEVHLVDAERGFGGFYEQLLDL